ncbi:SDR family NAD(P)-dependent oxidoreductase [Actinomadura bangladeshensis]|uniref:SDR family NAD(P)-dependent oxidoreductase n=1 Tax=Actinomadura bangladeshensis TaxID=453573 RepID=A0A4R4PDX7_9ACTN|nr:SDR family NAD(P)-dependent oxidoreductase [Actinomadura bangladeshensis]TDC18942.1 SDR family NAD(P)-dependent oxidoreductase [Actinomadura bangladeshensis]
MTSPNVLVTGASSGIGRATALLFAERGARVFGTSRRDRPDEAGVRMLRLDVRSDESVRACVGEVTAQAGGIDVLVNNAGVMHEGFAEETAPQEARAVFETNFFGAVRLVNAALPGMRERRRGRIVNVGSLAAWVGEPGEGFYAASKAALARYTESLRHEVWHLGIAVSLVEPGVFTTEVLNSSTATAGTAAIADYDGPRESARATLHDALRKGDDPGKAARIIWKAATVKAPRGRYGAGPQSFAVPRLKTLAPQRLVDAALRRAYRLPSRADR